MKVSISINWMKWTGFPPFTHISTLLISVWMAKQKEKLDYFKRRKNHRDHTIMELCLSCVKTATTTSKLMMRNCDAMQLWMNGELNDGDFTKIQTTEFFWFNLNLMFTWHNLHWSTNTQKEKKYKVKSNISLWKFNYVPYACETEKRKNRFQFICI